MSRASLGFPDPSRHLHGDSSVGAFLRAGGQLPRLPSDNPRLPSETPPPIVRLNGNVKHLRPFTDLHRHFVFEYYPWYEVNPYFHWNMDDRHPPVDLASNYMPALGAYDSRSTAVMEQHAQWIRETGAGAINVSWWGRDSDIDRLVPTLIDVMRAHDIHVTFHLEPYTNQHAQRYADDIRYLVARYGDARHWDAFLLLRNADGRVGPVFKSFRTILPPNATDCHGVTTPVPDYASDAVWRQQTDRVRQFLAGDFDHVTLLADSLDIGRTVAGGFDGIAIYDNYVRPATWPHVAHDCADRNVVFSFNINPGFDGIAPRHIDPGACYRPLAFEPPELPFDWSRAADREAAEAASSSRIGESFRQTISLQTDPLLPNVRHGFFLTYITSFNEWHEGHQFEPMKPHAALTADELAVGYHNPYDGSYRLKMVTDLIGDLQASIA